MPKAISLILHGFALALLGAVAITLYILGFSQLYIGGMERATLELVLSAVLFAFFYARILPYLNQLTDWFDPK